MDAALTMQPTRWEILQIIKRQGSGTVEQLASHLKVTPMAVRLHLVVLERDGLVGRGTLRHGPGRPALIYTLTPRAGDLFPKSYDVLANALLAVIKKRSGPEGLAETCRAAAAELCDQYRHVVAGKAYPERGTLVASIFSELGHDARFEAQNGVHLLKVYNCPYQRVAEKHREICHMDRQILSELLGADLEVCENLLDDAANCTYRIRPR